MRARCPVCGKEFDGDPLSSPGFPFCTPKCKLIDLGRWLDEGYSIPAEEQDEPPPGEEE
ncbi:MAG: DNA gyrase inhibitor YacG [Gemmataceae bacterium]|nr:DNA gyrase inhibitor YacG [Gemmataceae bacterium]